MSNFGIFLYRSKMAIAYVKYLEGPNKGKKAKVSKSIFRNKISSTAFYHLKKYYVKLDDGKHCKVQIIFIDGKYRC